MERAVAVGIGYSTPERIDEINILQATYEAMREAIGKLSVTPDILLNDAVTIPEVKIRQIPIIKGDAKSISIGAPASSPRSQGTDLCRTTIKSSRNMILPEIRAMGAPGI